jgi:hypothetical protein
LRRGGYRSIRQGLRELAYEIKGGAEAANGLNQLILAGLASLSAGTGSRAA